MIQPKPEHHQNPCKTEADVPLGNPFFMDTIAAKEHEQFFFVVVVF